MIEITNYNKSKVINKSKDLRGLLDYRKKDICEKINIRIIMDGGANFEVFFASGNMAESHFASFEICVNWFYKHFAKYYELTEFGDEYYTWFEKEN